MSSFVPPVDPTKKPKVGVQGPAPIQVRVGVAQEPKPITTGTGGFGSLFGTSGGFKAPATASATSRPGVAGGPPPAPAFKAPYADPSKFSAQGQSLVKASDAGAFTAPGQPSDFAHLAPWAANQVRSGGGNPSEFQMTGGALTRAPQPQYHDPAPPPDMPMMGNPSYNQFSDMFDDPEFVAHAYQNPRIMEAYLASRGQTQHATATGLAAANGHMADVFGDVVGSQANNYQSRVGASAARYGADSANAASENSAAAHLAASDPMRGIDALTTAMQNPAKRQALTDYNGMKQGDSQPVVPPGTAVDQGNLPIAMAEPKNTGIGAILGDENTDIQDKLKLLSGIQGMNDPQSQSHQMVQQWLQQKYVDPSQFTRETALPHDPDASWLGRNAPPLNRFLGVLNSAAAAVDPWATPADQNTGFSWRETRRKREEGMELMKALGFTPPDAPVPVSQ